jgi:hypothetical protein
MVQEKEKKNWENYMAATFPFVFNAPDASLLRPKGPRARLILPPNVNEPAAIKDLYRA